MSDILLDIVDLLCAILAGSIVIFMTILFFEMTDFAKSVKTPFTRDFGVQTDFESLKVYLNAETQINDDSCDSEESDDGSPNSTLRSLHLTLTPPSSPTYKSNHALQII